MITVSILLNGQPIFTRSAVKENAEKDWADYRIDDGTIICHRPSDGAVVLAKKMLDTIKEQGIGK